MYPVVFDPKSLRVALVGDGDAALRRLQGLDGAGAERVALFSPSPSHQLREAAGARLTERLPVADDLAGVQLVLVAGLADEVSGALADLARGLGIPVNVEDRKQWCDFHVPAVVRRGDLLLTISTGGASPGLAARIRKQLAGQFGPEWAERLDGLAAARAAWKGEGADPGELKARTEEWIDQRGWLG
jgi:precorrin-2 dehydrogenase/sirohydrochlorin ferrochelatase